LSTLSKISFKEEALKYSTSAGCPEYPDNPEVYVGMKATVMEISASNGLMWLG